MTSPRTAHRLNRLLAMLPWVIGNPGATVAEVCERFGYTERQLVADLDTVFVCGLPGYGPGDLMVAYIDEDEVVVEMADYFDRPVRLTAPEGLGLLASGRAILSTGQGSAALERAVGKLEDVLLPDGEGSLIVDLREPELVDRLRDGAAKGRVLRIEHSAVATLDVTVRDIEPWTVFSTLGNWYVSGYCRMAGAERVFRVDRIRFADETGETFEPPPEPPPPEVRYTPSLGDVRATIRLTEAARWVSDYYPVQVLEDDGATMVIAMSVSDPGVAARLLVRLGDDATLVAGDAVAEATDDLRRRILVRYGALEGLTRVQPRSVFLDSQPFAPDRFQVDAVAAFELGESVVVTAPTGSGKTLVAEAAIDITMANGKRAFYTTPIKALSNQKFTDLGVRYGAERVGLLTGDNTINGDAPIVVMTTEVLRNMIYADSVAIENLGTVVLDEVHYLQDRYRGSVWEEIIIHLPRAIPLVCLSATIANAEEFTEWIRERRGPTRLIVESHRPVPLESVYLMRDRHHDNAVEVYPIFSRDGKKPNPQVTKMLRSGKGRRRRFATPRRLEVVEALEGEGLLPAIYFIFSRAGCDQAAAGVIASSLELTTVAERVRIRAIADRRVEHLAPDDLTVLGFGTWSAGLERGVAAHHAGMVPAFKETVEELFAAGLVKVVFATETLALGINMPARSVVLEQLSKFTGEGHEPLRRSDYTQLTGRAGRRGIDTMGTSVVLFSQYVPFDKVADIAAAGSDPLTSSFQPTYNMAVNLIAKYPRERAEDLLRASFAQFRTESRRRDLQDRLAAKERDLATFREAAACERGDVWEYLGREGTSPARAESLRAFARGTHPGDVLDVGDGERSVLLVRGYGHSPRLLLLSSGGRSRRFRPEELGRNPARLGAIELPEPFRPRDPKYQKVVASRLRAWEPSDDRQPAFAADAATDPVGSCPELDDHTRWARRAARVEGEIRRLRKRVGRSGEDLVDRFGAILRVLTRWRFIHGWDLTERGKRLRFVFNELDLLLTEAVARGHLLGLDAPSLAATVSVFTYEERPRDEPGRMPSDTVMERAEQIMDLWDALVSLEREEGVPETRLPDAGFAGTVQAWAEGVDLEGLFGDDDFAAGDFVRNCRQLLDLLRQLRDAFPAIAEAASDAIRSVDRGIVAVGGRL